MLSERDPFNCKKIIFSAETAGPIISLGLVLYDTLNNIIFK